MYSKTTNKGDMTIETVVKNKSDGGYIARTDVYKKDESSYNDKRKVNMAMDLSNTKQEAREKAKKNHKKMTRKYGR